MRCAVLKTLRSGVAVCALLTTSGCYGYFDSPPETIQPGEQIRVRLSDSARQRVAPVGLQRELYLEGDLLDLTPDSAALAVWIGQAYRGTQFEAAHQTVTLPREQILGYQRRELSEWRTAATAVAIVGFAVVLISQIGFEEDPNAGGSETLPPPPPAGSGFRINILSGVRLLMR
jgi:hypothetical protein